MPYMNKKSEFMKTKHYIESWPFILTRIVPFLLKWGFTVTVSPYLPTIPWVMAIWQVYSETPLNQIRHSKITRHLWLKGCCWRTISIYDWKVVVDVPYPSQWCGTFHQVSKVKGSLCFEIQSREDCYLTQYSGDALYMCMWIMYVKALFDS